MSAIKSQYIVLSRYEVEDDEVKTLSREEAFAKAEADASAEGRTYYVAEILGGFKAAPTPVVPVKIELV